MELQSYSILKEMQEIPYVEIPQEELLDPKLLYAWMVLIQGDKE